MAPTTHCSLKMCIHTQYELSSTFWDTLWDSAFWVLFPWVVHGTCSGQWGEREDFQKTVQKARQATLTSTSSYTSWKHVSLFCYKKLVCSLFSRTVLWCFPWRPSWTTDTSVILFTTMRRQMSMVKILSWICPLTFSGIISSCFPNLLPVWYFRVMTLLEWSKDNDSKNLGGII